MKGKATADKPSIRIAIQLSQKDGSVRSRKARTELTDQPSFPPYAPYLIHPTQYQPQPHVQYTPYLYQQPITPRVPHPASPTEPAPPLEPPISPIVPSPDAARELSNYFNWLRKQPR